MTKFYDCMASILQVGAKFFSTQPWTTRGLSLNLAGKTAVRKF